MYRKLRYIQDRSGKQPLFSAREGEKTQMTQSDSQPQLPSFGNYRTIRRLGTGGFADAYLVEGQPGLFYAVKQIKREKISEDPKFRERFERETRLQASLRHPHVVKIIDYDIQQGYLVMEYADGGTLRAFLDDEYPNGVDLQTALLFLREIGSALTYLHEKISPPDEQHRGIAHLDLKPQNILIQIEPDPVQPGGGTRKRFLVADFSMAHQLSHTGRPQGGTSINDGSARYMAPEQADPEKWGIAGPHSDVYALGVILHEMLCGRRPPIGKPPRPLRELKKDIPQEVEEVIQRATAENPDERYGSIKGFVRVFTDAVAYANRLAQFTGDSQRNGGSAASTLPAVPLSPGGQLSSGRRRYIPWWQTIWGKIALAAGALLLVVGGSAGVTLLVGRLVDQSHTAPTALPTYQICIGTDFPISGSELSQGLAAQNGADLAISEHQNLGQGYTLISCNKDDVSPNTGIHDPAQGVVNITALVNDPRVVGIVGPGNSNVAEAEIPIITSAGLAMVSPNTTDLCLTLAQYCSNPDQVHPPGRSNAFFRIPPNDAQQGKADADLTYKELGLTTACVVDDQEAYGQGLADAFSANFQRDNGKIRGARLHITVGDTTAQLVGVARTCAALGAGAVFYGGTASNGAGLLKEQLALAGFHGLFVGGDGIVSHLQYLQDAGTNAENTYATALGPDPSTFSGPFVAAYRGFYKTQPDLASAQAYDAAVILINAIQSAIKANPVNLASLRQLVLNKVARPDQIYNGVTGTITFDSNGDNIAQKSFSVYAVVNHIWVYKPDYNVPA
jgi:branched-chain amino acid transport system substrate-binding protein